MQRNRLLAYLVGWGILSVAPVIPVVNVIALIAATVYGLGMLSGRGSPSGRPSTAT